MSNVYLPSTTTTSASTIWPTSSGVVWVSTANSTLPTPTFVPTVEVIPDHIVLTPGKARTITFPDGTIIHFEKNGSFKIEDQDAKVIYKAARVRDFNPFINASDKLEDFIKFCGSAGVRQGDMLGIPIKHFVQWLVIEAARVDGEPTTEVLMLPKPSDYPRCLKCGRFISKKLKQNRIEFCRTSCFEIKLGQVRKDTLK